MPKITRFLQKIFAGNYEASPTGQIAKFGSLAAGTALYTSDPATIQSLPAWLNGWSSATVGSKSPTLQDFNAFQYLVTRQLAYLLQAGIPEYDTSTTYYIGSFCQVAGVLYKSVTDNNTGNSVSNPTYWISPFATVATTGSYADLSGKPSSQLASAWANFKYVSGVLTVTKSYNISSISFVSNGVFNVSFTTPISSSDYCLIGSASEAIVSGALAPCYLTENVLSGVPVIKNATQVQITCVNNQDAVANPGSANFAVFA